MDSVNMEAHSFEAMMSRLEAFADKVEAYCRQQGDKKLKPKLDNQDVCEILGVTKRTLQSYRERGLLPYSRVEHKVFYEIEDVEKLLKASQNNPIK